MKATEKEYRLNYWYTEGIRLFKMWKQDNDEGTWKAFCCCVAVMCEYDRNVKDKRTQQLNATAWKYGWLKGEKTLTEWQESGCFDENFFNQNS